MAQHDPQAYGWLAALAVLLANTLYYVIKKILPKGADHPLVEALRHDVERLERLIEKLEAAVGDVRKTISDIDGDLKVVKSKLKVNGNK